MYNKYMTFAMLGFTLFVLCWTALFLIAAYYVFRKKLQQVLPQLLLATAFMSAFGPLGEIVVGSAYAALFGHNLWTYQILPIHHGYTSLIAPLIWGSSGIAMYCTLYVLKKHVPRRLPRFVLGAIDIMVVELALNVSHAIVFQQKIFHYLPGDLLHYSSLQTLPFYFIAALVASRALTIMRRNPYEFSLLFFGVTLTAVYLSR